MHEKEIVSSALLYRDQTDLKNFLKEQRRTAPPDCSWLVLIHTCCHSPASARRDRTARERSSSRCRSPRHQCSRRHSSRQHLYGPVPAAHHPIPPDTSGNFPAFPGRQNTGGAGRRSRRELPRRQPCPVCIFHRSVHAHGSRSCNIWNSCGSTFPLPAA